MHVDAKRVCASCGGTSTHATALFARAIHVDEKTSGLDGRPSYRGNLGEDAQILARRIALEACPHCPHVAPLLDVPYPGVAGAAPLRAHLFGAKAHDANAARYVYVAALFGDEDPRERGFWLLRAAWANEAAGLLAAVPGLRFGAARCLEEALASGYALVPIRGRSSVLLAELFRTAGETTRAAEHLIRGFFTRAPLEERRRMLAIAKALLDGSTSPLTCAEADALGATFDKDTAPAIAKKIEALAPPRRTLALAPLRAFIHPGVPLFEVGKTAAVFAQDFLDAELLAQMLATGHMGVWEGVTARTALFPELLRATDHADPTVRTSALKALFDKRLPDGLETTNWSSLARRLDDDDEKTVCMAGAILGQIIAIDRTTAEPIAAAASRPLPKWTKNLSVTGVLERLGGR